MVTPLWSYSFRIHRIYTSVLDWPLTASNRFDIGPRIWNWLNWSYDINGCINRQSGYIDKLAWVASTADPDTIPRNIPFNSQTKWRCTDFGLNETFWVRLSNEWNWINDINRGNWNLERTPSWRINFNQRTTWQSSPIQNEACQFCFHLGNHWARGTKWPCDWNSNSVKGKFVQNFLTNLL